MLCTQKSWSHWIRCLYVCRHTATKVKLLVLRRPSWGYLIPCGRLSWQVNPYWLLWLADELFSSLSFHCSVCIGHFQPNAISLSHIYTLSPSHFLSTLPLSLPYRGRFHIQQIHQSLLCLSSNPPLLFLLLTSSAAWEKKHFHLRPPGAHCHYILDFCSLWQPSPDCLPGVIITPYSSLSPQRGRDYLGELIIRPDMSIRLSPSQNLSVNCPAGRPKSSSVRWGCFGRKKINDPGYWCIMHDFLLRILLDALL